MIVDLHAHTTASDGVLEPAVLVQAAARASVDVLGITDHDTVDGIAEAQQAAVGSSTEILPGIEVSCFSGSTEIHILGLGIDPEAPGLQTWLDGLMSRRQERFHEMVERLGQMGMEIDANAILADKHSGSVGRPHIARALVAAGHAESVDEAFFRFLNKGQPAYVERYQLASREAIEWIHRAGGCAVQAHPGAMGNDNDIPSLAAEGLDGIEAHHPDHNADRRQHYCLIAQELNLLTTGGSDFHGDAAGRATGLGQRSTPPDQYTQLLERRERYRGPDRR
jgi:predicted metal-dependent phosphoesterase TrpH